VLFTGLVPAWLNSNANRSAWFIFICGKRPTLDKGNVEHMKRAGRRVCPLDAFSTPILDQVE
jgi:hypothetical protein